MKIRTRNFRRNEDRENFWPAFTDVMSNIVLVLIFLVLMSTFQQIISYKSLTTKINEAKDKLLSTEQELNDKKVELTDIESLLMLKENELEKTKAEVEQGQIELKLSAKMLEDREKIIANSNEELASLRAKLQEISVLRVDVINSVKLSIEEALGDSFTSNGAAIVTVGENANLVINESLLFGSGSAAISTKGKELLKVFAKAFERVLDDPKVRDNIDTINIEGHTDTVSSSAKNLELSCERAYNVENYMFLANPSLEAKGYGKYFSAKGFSEYRPIVDSGDNKDVAQNRRIEISINIKDANVNKIIDEYLFDSKEGQS